MTRRERIERVTSLNSRLRLAHDCLSNAFKAMDYQTALRFQVEVLELEQELRQFDDPFLPVNSDLRRW